MRNQNRTHFIDQSTHKELTGEFDGRQKCCLKASRAGPKIYHAILYGIELIHSITSQNFKYFQKLANSVGILLLCLENRGDSRNAGMLVR